MSNGKPRKNLTHVDETGDAHMVDVSGKRVTVREAEARGLISMQRSTISLVKENALVKGDVLNVARIAGIMAAKRTVELIPLCHAIPLWQIDLDFEVDEVASAIRIVGRAKTEARTGVEMEALVAVSVAALTIYDMCKSVDRGMTIGDIKLTQKSGGRSGDYVRAE